jgi:MinD-like ATPase involved in chromosome partitioning or flagellar assembly
LRSRYSKFLFKSVIPKNSTLAEAAFYGRPALLYSINSKGAQAYFELATEILARDAAARNVGEISRDEPGSFGQLPDSERGGTKNPQGLDPF